MSRGVCFDPTVTRSGTTKIAQPSMVKATSVAFEPVCRQFSGSQTASPDLPPTG